MMAQATRAVLFATPTGSGLVNFKQTHLIQDAPCGHVDEKENSGLNAEVTMSLQYQRQKPLDFYIPEICWRCDAPMKVKAIMPSMTFPLLDEAFIGLPPCHIERKQTVLRAARSS